MHPRQSEFHLRVRQVHLDFHTSPEIPDVGEDFDPDAFADTFARAHVDSVTIFAKCHHGWSYYDTKVGAKHPSLECDLMGEMIEALHKRDIRAPIYYSVSWDELAADEHPEWLLRRQDGSPVRPPFEPGWRTLCLNTAYTDLIVAATREILENYDVDGLFYDILFLNPCYCNACLACLAEAGCDPANREDQLAFRGEVHRELTGQLRALQLETQPEGSMYFNSLTPFQWGPFADFMTHLELECLPRGGWGYDFFPLCVRRASVYDMPLIGMTGRFLESWGHFGSVSPQASLEYECFMAIAHGASCSIGDQLHPRGQLDRAVYDLIGGVYRQVEEREAWCAGSRPIVETAVLSCNADGNHPDGFPESDIGAIKALTQRHYQFDVIDRTCDFARYPVLVIADELACDDDLAAKLHEYVSNGGKLLATHRAGVCPDGSGFALEDLPVTLVGDLPYSPDYLVPSGAWAEGLPEMPLVAYIRGLHVEAKPGANVLAGIADPYFDRTWEHFCSHFHTPVGTDSLRPGIVAQDNAIYFAHPLFTAYHRHGFLPYRDMLTRCLDRLLGERLIESDLPSSARITLMRQGERTVLHILYYVPERRTPRFEMVEDVVPLYGKNVSVRLGGKLTRVYLAPQEKELPFDCSDGKVKVEIPEIHGHQMVVFE